eukprot:scaffold1853_cov70-Skeletonema_dohrnii-CCMP3373.AAC.4
MLKAKDSTKRKRLFQSFTLPTPGYNTDTTRAVLIAKIRSLFPMNLLEILIDEATWAKSWRRSKEGTSVSISDFQFGHYIAGVSSVRMTRLIEEENHEGCFDR